jgi:hypothetical protein
MMRVWRWVEVEIKIFLVGEVCAGTTVDSCLLWREKSSMVFEGFA